MPKTLLYLMVAVLISLTNYANAQCPGIKSVYIFDQISIDRYFADGGCSVIEGDLYITGDVGENPITSLSGLSGITQVTGSIVVNRTLITSLHGLGSLTATNNISLVDNAKLTSMSQLNSLTSLGSIGITRCHNLTQFSIGQVTTLRSFYLVGANSIKNMSGLGNLVSIPNLSLHLQDMTSLESLDGLTNLTNLNGIWLENCPMITSISGLNGLTERLNNIHITGCPQLSKCNILPICNFVKTRSIIGSTLIAANNGAGCSVDQININCHTSLPVTLVKFQGKASEDNVELTWSTAEETDSKEFEVEHSANGKNWQSIGTVKSNENSYSEKNYQLIHDKPGLRNYYRLKMVDNDYSFAYSSVVHVMSGQIDNLISVYPNPASDYILIDQKFEADLSNVQVISLSGKVLIYLNKPASGKVKIKDLESGSYIIKARFNDDSETTRRIVIGR